MASQDERKAETRQRLLDAAADLFAARGVHAVSLEAVAEAADRTTGAIYAHFGSKGGLLLALLQETSRQVGRKTRGAVAGADGTDARLASLWSTFAERADAPGEEWMLLEHELWLHAARTPEARADLAERFAGARQLMGESFESWPTAGGSPAPGGPGDGEQLDGEQLDGEQLGALVLALLFGLEMQRRVDPTAVPDDLAVHGLRLLFEGRRTDPPPTQPPTNHTDQGDLIHADRSS
jgi:AcrR family transcriptional regulator